MARETIGDAHARCTHFACRSPYAVAGNFVRIAGNSATMTMLPDRTTDEPKPPKLRLPRPVVCERSSADVNQS